MSAYDKIRSLLEQSRGAVAPGKWWSISAVMSCVSGPTKGYTRDILSTLCEKGLAERMTGKQPDGIRKMVLYRAVSLAAANALTQSSGAPMNALPLAQCWSGYTYVNNGGLQ